MGGDLGGRRVRDVRIPAHALVVAVWLLTSCEKTEDHAVEKIVEAAISAHGRDAAVNVDRAHGSITVTLGRAHLPAGWPAAVPVYESASRAKIEETTAGRQRLSVATTDSAKDLAAYYRRALGEAGWQIAAGDARNLSAARGNERMRVRISEHDALLGGSRAEIEYVASGGAG